MESYWKVKIAIVNKNSMYVNTVDLGRMSVEDAKRYGEEEANDVYERLACEFNLPTFIDCARDIFEDVDAEDLYGLDEASVDLINEHFDFVKSLFLSWGLEEVK